MPAKNRIYLWTARDDNSELLLVLFFSFSFLSFFFFLRPRKQEKDFRLKNSQLCKGHAAEMTGAREIVI
jgi:hypothetical protein